MLLLLFAIIIVMLLRNSPYIYNITEHDFSAGLPCLPGRGAPSLPSSQSHIAVADCYCVVVLVFVVAEVVSKSARETEAAIVYVEHDCGGLLLLLATASSALVWEPAGRDGGSGPIFVDIIMYDHISIHTYNEENIGWTIENQLKSREYLNLSMGLLHLIERASETNNITYIYIRIDKFVYICWWVSSIVERKPKERHCENCTLHIGHTVQEHRKGPRYNCIWRLSIWLVN